MSGVVDAGPAARVHLSDARVLACMDRGPKKTAPDQCDRLKPVEDALSRAVEQTSSCVPTSGPTGTIEYVADVSFTRHKVRILLPNAGRSVTDRKVVSACAAAGAGAPSRASPSTAWTTPHARYKILAHRAVLVLFGGSAAAPPETPSQGDAPPETRASGETPQGPPLSVP